MDNLDTGKSEWLSRMDNPDTGNVENKTQNGDKPKKTQCRKLKIRATRPEQFLHFIRYLRHGSVVLINLSADSEAECSLIAYLGSDWLK